MPEYAGVLNRLRHELGKRYSLAHEHSFGEPGQTNILVRRRGSPDTLCISAQTRWLAALDVEASTASTRVEYKHLLVLIRRFFDRSGGDFTPTLEWPGTQESREAARRALDPRRFQKP